MCCMDKARSSCRCEADAQAQMQRLRGRPCARWMRPSAPCRSSSIHLAPLSMVQGAGAAGCAFQQHRARPHTALTTAWCSLDPRQLLDSYRPTDMRSAVSSDRTVRHQCHSWTCVVRARCACGGAAGGSCASAEAPQTTTSSI